MPNPFLTAPLPGAVTPLHDQPKVPKLHNDPLKPPEVEPFKNPPIREPSAVGQGDKQGFWGNPALMSTFQNDRFNWYNSRSPREHFRVTPDMTQEEKAAIQAQQAAANEQYRLGQTEWLAARPLRSTYSYADLQPPVSGADYAAAIRRMQGFGG